MKKKSDEGFKLSKHYFVYALLILVALSVIAYADYGSYGDAGVLEANKINTDTMQYHQLRYLAINNEGDSADADEDGKLDLAEGVQFDDLSNCYLVADENGDIVCAGINSATYIFWNPQTWCGDGDIQENGADENIATDSRMDPNEECENNNDCINNPDYGAGYICAENDQKIDCKCVLDDGDDDGEISYTTEPDLDPIELPEGNSASFIGWIKIWESLDEIDQQDIINGQKNIIISEDGTYQLY